MNIKWEVLKLQVHSKLLTGGCLKIKFLIMKAVFQSSILFLLLSEIVFGQEQVHGFFKFIGFFNEPQIYSIINNIHNKSRSGCSSECLKDEHCYFFDFCKTGSSTSCYFYNNNLVNTSRVQNGMCRRYELVSTLYSSTEFLNRGLCSIRVKHKLVLQTIIFFMGITMLNIYYFFVGDLYQLKKSSLFCFNLLTRFLAVSFKCFIVTRNQFIWKRKFKKKISNGCRKGNTLN